MATVVIVSVSDISREFSSDLCPGSENEPETLYYVDDLLHSLLFTITKDRDRYVDTFNNVVQKICYETQNEPISVRSACDKALNAVLTRLQSCGIGAEFDIRNIHKRAYGLYSIELP